MSNRFKVSVTGTYRDDKIILLEDAAAKTTVEVFAFGALLNAFTVVNAKKAETNVVEGYVNPVDAKANITDGFKSAKLSPFVCRMKNGEYDFDGHAYKVEKFYMQESAIHGLIYDAVYDITNTTANDDYALVTLNHSYKQEDKGYPFSYEVAVTYKLEKDNRLTIVTVIKPGGNAMPLSDGWHPYFKLGETINTATFCVNSSKMVEFGEGLLPSGKYLENEYFTQAETFNNTELDNCFLLKNTGVAACILADEATGVQLSIVPGSTYPYLQVYTPPHRKSVAIENLSSPPDAFNNQMNIIHAKPHTEFKFETTYIVSLI